MIDIELKEKSPLGNYKLLLSPVFLLIIFGTNFRDKEKFVVYVTEPPQLTFHWKDGNGQIFRSIGNLKRFTESKGKKLVFAMNGGMYRGDHSPQGLFIENSIELSPLDSLSGAGNFYMKPNGIFYITRTGTAIVSATDDFKNNGEIKFATQSGPMLLIDGQIHPAFKEGSTSLNIRNGVGILPDNRVVFAISKQEVNFHDFAMFFKRLNCKNALYLDGFVSRAYIPGENWKQLDGDFGVIIAVLR